MNRDPMGTGHRREHGLQHGCVLFRLALPRRRAAPPAAPSAPGSGGRARRRVEHGGNKSGIPYGEWLHRLPRAFPGQASGLLRHRGHDARRTVAGRPSHEKEGPSGAIAVVMTGGRIGKDGIHGATFSSEELHEGSPATAVQIGDPITQRRMYDFLDACPGSWGCTMPSPTTALVGFPPPWGRWPRTADGCEIDLAKAPLKYDGLSAPGRFCFPRPRSG